MRAAAKTDPVGFVNGLPAKTILDEVRVRELFTSLRGRPERVGWHVRNGAEISKPSSPRRREFAADRAAGAVLVPDEQEPPHADEARAVGGQAQEGVQPTSKASFSRH